MNVYTKLILITFLLCADCAVHHDSNSSNLSYDFTENSCPTDKHEFSSTDALCRALQDETLNHGCASDLREAMFNDKCSGQTYQPFYE